MPQDVVVALLAFLGTVVGALAGILTTAKLVTFRLEQLEKKVEKHNNLVERMVAVESSTKSAHKRIDELVKE